MKKIFLLVAFFVVLTECNAQNEKKVEVSELVRIVDASDINIFINLVKDLGYVVDSSQNANGFRTYLGRENITAGNVLRCSVSSENKIDLSFSTRDISTYKKFKKQIEELDFKTSGLNKSGFPGILEAENFTKGKFLINVVSRKKEMDKIEYDFTFLHWVIKPYK